MNYLHKIDFMIAEKKRVGYTGPYMIDIDFYKNGWAEGELESIVKDYPSLPESYIDFIKKYDSIGIAWFVFYGSEANKIIPLKTEIPYWREEGLPEEYFPFGKGPSGELYTFNSQGKVIHFRSDDYDFENPDKVAETFEEFVNDCLLGNRYAEFNMLEKDTFYLFMKEQGWIS